MFVFEPGGLAAPYGFALASAETAPRRRVPKPRTRYLRLRSEQGPWIEAWADRPAHPYNELFMRIGIRAIAYAPVRDNARVIGFFAVGSAAPNAEEELAAMLPAIVECSDIRGTLLGVAVAERSVAKSERHRISQVIDGRAFYPVYQPLVDVAAGTIVGYESLTRFADGSLPHFMFDEAHQAGLGCELELAAIRAAIDGAGSLPPGVWLNVNASPQLVLAGRELSRVLAGAPRDIVLEVTEHSEIKDYARFRRVVQELGPAVRLAVDDAGSGFASLRHIIELRPAFVKLDREVIGGLDHDEARKAMVAGLAHFALGTGCWLIAEGVETEAELRALQALNVHYVQGYLLGRPLPASELVHGLAGGAGDSANAWSQRRRQ
jgi:EAL domain-containing protein (putative c-di-GMP-specific phosphodiesterase class I)